MGTNFPMLLLLTLPSHLQGHVEHSLTSLVSWDYLPKHPLSCEKPHFQGGEKFTGESLVKSTKRQGPPSRFPKTCKCHLIATELLQQPRMLCILLFFACIWFKRNSSLGSNLACRAFLAWGSITYIRQWARNLFSVVGKLQEGRFKASLGKKASEAGRVTRGANCQGALLSVLVPSCWGESVFAGVPYDMYKLSLQCSRDVCLLGWVMTAYKNTLSVTNWWLLGCCSRGRTDVLQDFWSVQGGLRQQNEVAPAPQLSWDRLPSCIFALAANRKAWPHMYSLLLAIFNIYHENAMKKERLMQCKSVAFLILVHSFVPSPVPAYSLPGVDHLQPLPFPTACPCPVCHSPTADLQLTKLGVHPLSGSPTPCLCCCCRVSVPSLHVSVPSLLCAPQDSRSCSAASGLAAKLWAGAGLDKPLLQQNQAAIFCSSTSPKTLWGAVISLRLAICQQTLLLQCTDVVMLI